MRIRALEKEQVRAPLPPALRTKDTISCTTTLFVDDLASLVTGNTPEECVKNADLLHNELDEILNAEQMAQNDEKSESVAKKIKVEQYGL